MQKSMKQKEFFLQLGGDCGNHQPWSHLVPFFLCSQLAWNLTEKTDEEIDPPLIVKSFFARDSGLGKLSLICKTRSNHRFNLPNNSLPWFAFTAANEKLCIHISEQVSTGQILKGLDWQAELKEKKFSLKNTSQGEVMRRN